MRIRPFVSDDLGEVVDAYTVSIRVLAVGYYSSEQIAAWAPVPADMDGWRGRLAGLRTLVAEIGGAVAGFASYTQEGYLDFLFTHPSYARRGVASGLCRRVESDLKHLGVSIMTAHVSLAARCFFDQQGFCLGFEEEVECRGVRMRRFGMHKDLHP